MPGIKHLIECHCVLPLYKNSQKIIYHKFPVYSKFDDKGRIEQKLVKCNNCDALHLIKEICRSEIKPGKDQSSLVVTKEDLSYMLSDKIVSILEKVDADISTWEQIADIVEEERWKEQIVIKRDIIDEVEHVKIIEVLGENKLKIYSDVIRDIISE
tara:strand:+ start:31 stop:498 length:468 start_codon:yes stop_codon:yes gene_type:complete